MNISRCKSMIKAGVMDSLQFRMGTILMLVCNLLYLVMVYYLWKAIFAGAGSDIVNGMTFSDTMIYLVFASSLFGFMEMWLPWNMGTDIKEGKIIVDLLKPIAYPTYSFFKVIGNCIMRLFTTFLPTAVVVYFVSEGAIYLGWNIAWFIISAFISLIINFYINFMIGTVCMYTESIWGINIMKEVIVGLLSGSVVPLAFFPDVLGDVVMFLPFQAIINSPLELLLHSEYGLAEITSVLAIQLFWLIVLHFLANWFFKVSVRRITVNGG